MKLNLYDIKDSIEHFQEAPLNGKFPSGMKAQDIFNSFDEIAVFDLKGQIKNNTPFKAKHLFLIFGMEGKCDVTVGNHQVPVLPNTISLISPQQMVCFTGSNKQFKAKLILFTKEALSKSYLKEIVLEELLNISQDYPPSYNLFETRQKQSITQLFNDVEHEYQQKNAFHLNVIRLKIIGLLYEYNRACEYCMILFKKKMNRPYQLTIQFKKLVDKHFRQKKSVNYYAGLLSVSPKHLSEMIKAETGTAALEIIHNRILLEAQYLLKHSDKSTKEISSNLHFDTISHFSRFFKSKTGFTPLQYRINP